VRALALLKQASAAAAETDQASDQQQRSEFTLDVSENPPTADQLRSILEYVGEARARDVVDGAAGVRDAIQKLELDKKRFKAPVIVDWNNGKAVIGDNESEILKMIKSLPQEK